MRSLTTTPKQDGFRMPGEYEQHRATYILWPERTDNWRLGAKPAQQAFVEVATAISRFEEVVVGVSYTQYDNARHMLPEQVRVVEISNNDSWIRDSGPTCVVNDLGEVRAIDWKFNAYGGLKEGLYFPWDQDDKVARKVAEMEDLDYYRLKEFILEGGSIHVDGEGTLITTEECLLNEDRNPDMTKEQIENTLKEYLNVTKIIWLKKGIYLDETNGHVDNICCFVRPGVVALAWSDNPNDPEDQISTDAYSVLKEATDAKGRKLEIHKIPIPTIPITITQEESEGVDAIEGTLPRTVGERLAASYVNYYTCNGAVILPTFGDPNDEVAINILKGLYPNREIVPIYAREILLGGGNIHCITQQIPKGQKK